MTESRFPHPGWCSRCPLVKNYTFCKYLQWFLTPQLKQSILIGCWNYDPFCTVKFRHRDIYPIDNWKY